MKNIIKKIKHFFVQPKISIGVFIVFLLLAVLVGWRTEVFVKNERQSDLFARHPLGEEVQMNGLTFAVESIRRDEVGAGPLAPRLGYEFVIATISVKNTSSASFDFIPFLFLHIKDAPGNVFNVVAIPSESNQLSGQILPYDSLREEVGFEVTKNANGLTLYFDPGMMPDRTIAAVNLEVHKSWWQF